MVWRQADQVALPGDGDLQGLANPPRRVGRQAGAVADVEAVDGLHQPADGFLQQVGVAESVVAKALGDVGGEANVGRGEAMLKVNVAIVQAANCHDTASVIIAVVADKLSHGPRLQSGAMLAEAGEVADEHPHQFTFRFPEIGEQFALFLGSEQIRRENRGRCHRCLLFSHWLALPASRLHGRLSLHLEAYRVSSPIYDRLPPDFGEATNNYPRAPMTAQPGALPALATAWGRLDSRRGWSPEYKGIHAALGGNHESRAPSFLRECSPAQVGARAFERGLYRREARTTFAGSQSLGTVCGRRGGSSLIFLTCRVIVKSRRSRIKIYYRKVAKDFWEHFFPFWLSFPFPQRKTNGVALTPPRSPCAVGWHGFAVCAGENTSEVWHSP